MCHVSSVVLPTELVVRDSTALRNDSARRSIEESVSSYGRIVR